MIELPNQRTRITYKYLLKPTVYHEQVYPDESYTVNLLLQYLRGEISIRHLILTVDNNHWPHGDDSGNESDPWEYDFGPNYDDYFVINFH